MDSWSGQGRPERKPYAGDNDGWSTFTVTVCRAPLCSKPEALPLGSVAARACRVTVQHTARFWISPNTGERSRNHYNTLWTELQLAFVRPHLLARTIPSRPCNQRDDADARDDAGNRQPRDGYPVPPHLNVLLSSRENILDAPVEWAVHRSEEGAGKTLLLFIPRDLVCFAAALSAL